jgi:YARHG domain-containing protein
MRRACGQLAALPLAAFAGSSQAYGTGLCFETVGCVQNRLINESDAAKLGCDQLWTVRNGIYAVRGYCFKTERGKQNFSNEG